MLTASGNYSATVLVAKTGRFINMLVETFTDDYYYLSASENFPRILPETINDAINYN